MEAVTAVGLASQASPTAEHQLPMDTQQRSRVSPQPSFTPKFGWPRRCSEPDAISLAPRLMPINVSVRRIAPCDLSRASTSAPTHAGDINVFRGSRGNLVKMIWHDGSVYRKRCAVV